LHHRAAYGRDADTAACRQYDDGDLPQFRRREANPWTLCLPFGKSSPIAYFQQAPQGTKSLAVIVDDPDAPAGLWTHWVIWNIPASIHSIEENTVPSFALQGRNSFGNCRYDGPAPLSGTHRYFFHVYALDTVLPLPSGASRGKLEAAMKDHVLAGAETYGTFSASP